MLVFVSTPVSEALAAAGAFRINPAGVLEFTHGSCGGSEDTCGFIQTVSTGRHVDKVTDASGSGSLQVNTGSAGAPLAV